ncbi:DUF5906 domain-containing protein [Antarctobacter jejuensis]|uniref:DUF5906 domain-containing protein n=1 Tax=Antarctobacter jejuensis TaxID=1439938 RepID=UPI003FD0390B
MDKNTANATQLQDEIMRETADLREIHAALMRVKPKSKAAIEKGWSKAPVLTGDAFAAKRQPGENVGIRLGEPSKALFGYFCAIDFDVKTPEAEPQARAALLRHCPNAMDLPSVISGSGGASRHFYIFSPEPLASWTIAKGDGWEVAVKGTGTYVVAPGSIHPDTGQPYCWERPLDLLTWELTGAPVVDVSLLQRPERMAPAAPADPLSLDRLEAALRGIDPKELHRDEWRNVGMAVCYETGGSEAGFRAFDAWSQRDPERYKGERDTRSQWRSFGKSNRGQRIKGATILFMEREAYARAIVASLDEELEDLPEPFEDLLGEDEPTLNDRYAMVRVGKDVQIVDRKADGLSLISVRAFRDLHAFQGRGDKWIKSEKRTTFEGGLTFDPSGRVHKDKLNLWKGFAIEPNETGNCDLIVNHIRDVWASGDTAHFDYIVSWLADIVQNPANKPRVALVLKGGKGAGKDSLVDLMRRIVGSRHYALANSPDVLTSNFNGLYDTALLIHAEEASWGGDKQAKGKLQSLITNSEIRIERKGVDAVQIPSFHRVIFSTNEEWAVPATADERRYAVFNVSDHRIGDHDYFDALHRQIKGDGAAAFMAFLMAWETPDGIRIGKPPQTRGLLDQKLAGLRNVEAWWFEKLCAGFTGSEEFGDESEWRSGPLEIIKTDLHSDYCYWMHRQRHHGDTKGREAFAKSLNAMCPMMETRRRRGGSAEGSGRQRAYWMPQLDECRRAFAGYMKSDEAHFSWSEENG